MHIKKLKTGILIEAILLCSLFVVWSLRYVESAVFKGTHGPTFMETFSEDTPIKWVDFNVSYEALCEAYTWDVETYYLSKGKKQAASPSVHVRWVELLSYAAAKNGGAFPKNSVADIKKAAKLLSTNEITLDKLTCDLKYYSYYFSAFSAVLDGYVGEYQLETPREDGSTYWKSTYGLKAFSPIAKGFDYSDFDDFGTARSYGYSRPHLGHDMVGQIGTPIISIESGYVEAIGWNQYGGWRLGIRSFDGKRYYYYAHLRQNFPYALGLEEGTVVTAGEVIGYMGHTGYSVAENVNNIEIPHLHWGLQLIFDETQKDSDNEIWVDCYNLSRFLYQNRSETIKKEDTKEWHRTYDIKDPAVEQHNSFIDKN